MGNEFESLETALMIVREEHLRRDRRGCQVICRDLQMRRAMKREKKKKREKRERIEERVYIGKKINHIPIGM